MKYRRITFFFRFQKALISLNQLNRERILKNLCKTANKIAIKTWLYLLHDVDSKSSESSQWVFENGPPESTLSVHLLHVQSIYMYILLLCCAHYYDTMFEIKCFLDQIYQCIFCLFYPSIHNNSTNINLRF